MALIQSSRRSFSSSLLVIFIILLAAAAGGSYFLFFEGEPPQITLGEPQEFLGAQSAISFSFSDGKSGLRAVQVTVIQGEKSYTLYQETFPRHGTTGMIGLAKKEEKFVFQPLKHDLKDGAAVLELTATDYSCRSFFRGNKTTTRHEVTIDTTPPKIGILYSDRYISPGSAGMVVYRLDDPNASSGLTVNSHNHPGFPIGDGRDDTYLAFFALPYDAQRIESAAIVAVDAAGNKTEVPFSSNFKAAHFKHDEITIPDSFLETKIPEFSKHYPDMKGTPIDQYLFINSSVRNENNTKISALCAHPSAKRLWQGSFDRMSGSTRAGFADYRSYNYNGQQVDEQVHLGIDIASTQRAEVRAAAAGTVVFADYLGIYGNMVLLDHGQGIFSLYSHLSQINVPTGETVAHGATIGLTGTSGMAGGDHLHFSILINGIFVTPLEWWDQHWIDVNIEGPLQDSKFR